MIPSLGCVHLPPRSARTARVCTSACALTPYGPKPLALAQVRLARRSLSTWRSSTELSHPSNSYFVSMRPDAVAAIRTAHEMLNSELGVVGGRRWLALWELVEGGCQVLTSRFAVGSRPRGRNSLPDQEAFRAAQERLARGVTRYTWLNGR